MICGISFVDPPQPPTRVLQPGGLKNARGKRTISLWVVYHTWSRVLGSTSPTNTNLARVQPVRGSIRGLFGAKILCIHTYILLLFSSRWEHHNQILNVRDILSKPIETIFGFNTVENFKILLGTSWSNKSKFHEGNCCGKEIEALCSLWWMEIKVLMLRSLWLKEIKNGIFFSCHCTHWGPDLCNLYFLHEGHGWCKQSFSWWLWNM